MLSDICYEQIRGDYWFGCYDEFKVVINKSNSFLNISRLCSDGGKQFKHWIANASSKKLIHALTQQLSTVAQENTHVNSNGRQDPDAGIPTWACKCITKIVTSNMNEADKIICGTYIHIDLVPHVACWISEHFALKVSKN